MDKIYINEFDPSEIYTDYQRALEEENERQRSNSDKILAEVDKMVSVEYSKAIREFLYDEENGIWGGLKLVDKPIGKW